MKQDDVTPSHAERGAGGRRSPALGRLGLLAVAAGLVAALCLAGPIACSSGDEGDGSTTSTKGGGLPSGDVEAVVGKNIELGDVVLTVRALQATFQPATPVQRLSEQTPVALASGESFYQAYVRVLNNGEAPLRVDAEDFALAVGDGVVGIEPTRSGPPARSLLLRASLDLLLTFKAEAGYEPVLLYNPPWYEGTVRVGTGSTTTTTSE